MATRYDPPVVAHALRALRNRPPVLRAGPLVGGAGRGGVPRSGNAVITWTLGRRGSLLGVDQWGNGYRIERAGAGKRGGGVVLSILRVSTNMLVSVTARTPRRAQLRARHLYADVLGSRAFAGTLARTGDPEVRGTV